MQTAFVGMVRHYKSKDMNVETMPWWEREKLLTAKDKEAIKRAVCSYFADIDEDWAETEAGRYELHSIIMRKYHNEELSAGIQ